MMVLFMVNVLGYSELWAAFGTMPMAAVACVVSPLSGRLVDSLGPRQVAAAGGLLFGTAFLLMASLDGQATLWSLAWRQALLGLGMSLTMPALTTAGLTPLPQQSSGVGSGTNSTARACGNALGVALLLAVFESTRSYSSCFFVAGIICFLSVPLSVFLGKHLGHRVAPRAASTAAPSPSA
ncbi:MAG: MFS transporter [Armatimonadetes bacterium]|nr:MFS transporter [Armatimonadota bacterium]